MEVKANRGERVMDAWKNDPYELPILADARYACPCGGAADMDSFWGGPAYAHHWHYAIKCRMPTCERNKVRMNDWKDTPAEAIRAWNRRCLDVEPQMLGGGRVSEEKHYRCIKEFSVPLCDEDGCAVESGETTPVEVGETFRRSTVTWMNDVRLEGVGNTYWWLEISEETFKECFEEVSE